MDINVFIFIAVCWIAAGTAIYFGPRTSKRSLEEINNTYKNEIPAYKVQPKQHHKPFKAIK